MKQITYFDTAEKLLQNLSNCVDKDIDPTFTKEALKTIITLMKTQNNILESIVEKNNDVEIVKNAEPIVKGMICYIREKKKFGQIIKIEPDGDICTLKILGTDNIITVTKNQFNI